MDKSPLLHSPSLQDAGAPGEVKLSWLNEESKPQTVSTPFPPMIAKPALWQVILYGLVILAFALALTVFSDDLDNYGVTQDKILKLGSIPIVSVVFTYFHIWLALWMTFYPLEFFGLLQIPGTNTGLGWQGIIPNKAEKMARKSVQLMKTKLIDVKEVFARLDPKRMAEELESVVHDLLGQIIDSVAREHAPTVWGMVPNAAREEIIAKANEDAPQVMTLLMGEMREKIEDVFDIEDMVVRALTKDKALLNNIFIRCGYKELCFIRNSGAWMGFIFGIFQMVIWIFYQAHWILPAIGFAVGAATNWIALKIIFSPIDPHDCGCCIWQGLFLKRQAEVSAEYGDLVAHRVLTASNIIASIISGPTTDRLIDMATRHIQAATDKFAGVSPSFIAVTLGHDKYSLIKQQVCDRFINTMPQYIKKEDIMRIEKYTDTALDMENLLRNKMTALPSQEFERLLHPVFEEDEWKLILVGGVLGVVVGIAQAYGLQT